MVLCLLVVSLAFSSAVFGITVRTPVGDVIGVEKTLDIDGTPRRISVFSGIPYAESTSGANRFMKPIPKTRFNTPFNATDLPAGCRQASDFFETYGLRYSEDCLVLSVFVPRQSDQTAQLPVMVWFYGGGFLQGTIATYPADVLSAFGNVAVVTVNYRVGALGFLRSSDGQLIGNQGLWDQHLALRWVHDNIAAFSGNPAEVTIFGESAGAASVSLQALYPGNRGLFRRVITESGSAVAPWAFTEHPNTDEFLSSTGCGLNVSCLQTLPAENFRIHSLEEKVTQMFRPTVDGEFLKDTPNNILFGEVTKNEPARNFFLSLDILTGVNSVEGASYVPVLQQIIGFKDVNNFTLPQESFSNTVVPYIIRSILHVNDTNKSKLLRQLISHEYSSWTDADAMADRKFALVQLMSDCVFFYPALQTAAVHRGLTGGRQSTFVYEFAVNPSNHDYITMAWNKGVYDG